MNPKNPIRAGALVALVAITSAQAVMVDPKSAPASAPEAPASTMRPEALDTATRGESHTRVEAVVQDVDVAAGTMRVGGVVLKFAPDMKVFTSAGSSTNAYAVGKGAKVWLQFEGASITPGRAVKTVWLR